jgi:hypothetical protein
MGRTHIIRKSGTPTADWKTYRGSQDAEQLVEIIQKLPVGISADTIRLICDGHLLRQKGNVAAHTITEEQAKIAVEAMVPERKVRKQLEELIKVIFPKPV